MKDIISMLILLSMGSSCSVIAHSLGNDQTTVTGAASHTMVVNVRSHK